jgi:ABC-type uncharacterized transport system permease subunit
MILASTLSASFALGLAAALAYAVPALGSGLRPRASSMNPRLAELSLVIAWALHGAVLAITLWGRAPHFGFAQAVSMTAWLVLTVYGIESRLYPRLRAQWWLSGLGSAAVLLALWFPGVPLQREASPWLPLHLALGVASYGLFAAAVVHGWLMTRAERQIRGAADAADGLPLLTLERLTFRFVQAGFVLLSATLLAGFFFGEDLYGSARAAWRVDHKTVFSVLSWLCFAVLLAGRARLGWRGRFAVRMLYGGAGLLLLAYVGSRFVLEVVLGRSV